MIFTVFFSWFLSIQADQARLKVHLTDIKADSGVVYVALYQNPDNFLSQDVFLVEKSLVNDGKASVHLMDLPFGTYAVSAFYDTNGNGQLDTNFLGIPKEPYAFSGSPSGFGPPSFEKASFTVDEADTEISISF